MHGYLSMDTICFFSQWRGTGKREPRRRGGGRGQKAGEQGAWSGIYMRVGSESRNKEGNSLLFINGYHSVKNTCLEKFWNFHLTSTDALKKTWEARKRKFCTRVGKTASLLVNLEIPWIRLRQRSWDSIALGTCVMLSHIYSENEQEC